MLDQNAPIKLKFIDMLDQNLNKFKTFNQNENNVIYLETLKVCLITLGDHIFQMVTF